ncbi:MAG: hypothetical protein ACOZNI_26095 [Myxococcota bacterium]
MRALVGFVPFAVACVPVVGRTTYVRELEQVGAVPAPAGPKAVGPLPPAGDLAVEGSLSVGLQTRPDETREEGASGSLAAQDWGRVRVAWGATPGFEAGALLEVSPEALAMPMAKGLPRRDGTLARAGTSARLRTPLFADVYVGFTGEAEVGVVTFTRTETLTRHDTWWKEGEESSTSTSRSAHEEEDAVVTITGRAGPVLSWEPVDGIAVAAGLLVQEAPVLYGYDDAVWTCTSYADGSRDCEDVPARPADTWLAWVGTAHANVAVPVDRWTFWVQGWGSFAGHVVWMEAAPAGFDTGVRYTR